MSEIDSSQIQDGTIVNADISASAAIATSKLADGSQFIKKNGSVIMESDLNMGNHTLNDISSATDNNQPVPKHQMDTAITGVNTTIAANLALSVQLSKLVFNQETPSGTIDGTNRVFTLANIPVTGTVLVFRNGSMDLVGAGEDYTISGATITYNVGKAPLTGAKIRVIYIKV